MFSLPTLLQLSLLSASSLTTTFAVPTSNSETGMTRRDATVSESQFFNDDTIADDLSAQVNVAFPIPVGSLDVPFCKVDKNNAPNPAWSWGIVIPHAKGLDGSGGCGSHFKHAMKGNRNCGTPTGWGCAYTGAQGDTVVAWWFETAFCTEADVSNAIKSSSGQVISCGSAFTSKGGDGGDMGADRVAGGVRKANLQA